MPLLPSSSKAIKLVNLCTISHHILPERPPQMGQLKQAIGRQIIKPPQARFGGCYSNRCSLSWSGCVVFLSDSRHSLMTSSPFRLRIAFGTRCFRLFDSGWIPSQMSCRQCEVGRGALCQYCQAWKPLEAKRYMILLKSKQELDLKREAGRGVTIQRLSP
jgi:hypothetical protein